MALRCIVDANFPKLLSLWAFLMALIHRVSSDDKSNDDDDDGASLLKALSIASSN